MLFRSAFALSLMIGWRPDKKNINREWKASSICWQARNETTHYLLPKLSMKSIMYICILLILSLVQHAKVDKNLNPQYIKKNTLDISVNWPQFVWSWRWQGKLTFSSGVRLDLDHEFSSYWSLTWRANPYCWNTKVPSPPTESIMFLVSTLCRPCFMWSEEMVPLLPLFPHLQSS